MITEKFIQEIAGMALAKAPLETIDLYTKGVRLADGSLQELKLDPRPRTTTVYSIADLVSNVRDWKDKDENAEIYYSRNGIRGFWWKDRRESVTMELTKSKPFELLESWDKKPESIKQDTLFLLLKTTFRGCCDDLLEKVVKTIRWTMGNNGESTVRQGSVSMNKSIIAEMTGAEDLNKIEYVVFTVPVFLELPDVKAIVECHIRPIPDQQMFSVIPTGGYIEQSYRMAEDSMRLMIENTIGDNDGIRIYHGAANADNPAAVQMI
jgi:hypothetical protein